jgi:hypothetical protein
VRQPGAYPFPEDFPLECREDGEQTGVVNSTATATGNELSQIQKDACNRVGTI